MKITVAQYIEQLRMMPPDLPVVMHNVNGVYDADGPEAPQIMHYDNYGHRYYRCDEITGQKCYVHDMPLVQIIKVR